jgi:transglutaminase-like putative cysteine protease
LAVEHTTTTTYASDVSASYNEARLTPHRGKWQTVLESSVEVFPRTSLYRYVDYWGTVVHMFDLFTPHAELQVVGKAVVDTYPAASPRRTSWEPLADERTVDRWCEFLSPTPYVDLDPELVELAASIKAASALPTDAVEAAIAAVRDRMVYERGHTTVSTSASEAWASRRGVCQDFVHVSLALLRAMGIPARYVSGYLHPDPTAGIGAPAVGESHAWIDAWLTEWVAFDPTSGAPVGERHVSVARARDYGDVAPLRGIYTGSGATDQKVVVEVTRLS